MSKSVLLIVFVAIILVGAIVATVVATNAESEQSATASDASGELRMKGSDNIFLDPPVPLPTNYYKGSDWIERHPTADVPVNYYSLATPLP